MDGIVEADETFLRYTDFLQRTTRHKGFFLYDDLHRLSLCALKKRHGYDAAAAYKRKHLAGCKESR